MGAESGLSGAAQPLLPALHDFGAREFAAFQFGIGLGFESFVEGKARGGSLFVASFEPIKKRVLREAEAASGFVVTHEPRQNGRGESGILNLSDDLLNMIEQFDGDKNVPAQN